MRLILTFLVIVASSKTFAAGAHCGKYTANLAKSGKAITILTHAADYVRGAGYTDVGTSVSGAINASCERFYSGESEVCSLNVVNVELISNTECWE